MIGYFTVLLLLLRFSLQTIVSGFGNAVSSSVAGSTTSATVFSSSVAGGSANSSYDSFFLN